MLWPTLLSQVTFRHFSLYAFHLAPHPLRVFQVRNHLHNRAFTSEMKRNAEESLQTEERPRNVVRIDASIGVPSTSDKPNEDVGHSVRTQKKTKREKALKEGDKKPKVGRRGRRRDAIPVASLVEGEESRNDAEPKGPRLPKRQSALLIGFCGTGYSGMQFQPDVPRTIEGTLFDALVKTGAISQDNADDPVKVSLARAARTDAGVHAAGNVVSMKIITSIPDVPDPVARINELLPPEIRLWGYVRAQNSFNARLACDSRKYTYYFPSYILLPPKPGSGLGQVLQKHDASLSREISGLDHGFWESHESSTKEEDLVRKRAWRVNPGEMEKLRDIVARFEGTHNFHNFTVGREFKDPSNQRHMKKIEVADPAVYGETEWISVLFHGQSFMLHQIRKMMTALVMTCRTGTPNSIIDELYGPRVVLVPKMPSLGLLLEEPVFDSYNSRMAVINEHLHPSNPAYRPPIDFDLYRDQIVKFKDDFIYKNMREVEDQTGLFDAWIRSVDTYSGNDLLYFNSKGTIPEVAIIQKGVKREDPFREKKKFNTTGLSPADSRLEEKAQEDEDEDEDLAEGREVGAA